MTDERKGKGLLNKINAALKKSRDALSAPISNVLGRTDSDEPAWEDLEEALIRADVGVSTAVAAVAAARREAGRNTGDPAAVKKALKREIISVLAEAGCPPAILDPEDTLTVLILAGVNGAGKTTTAGKIAGMAAGKGRKAVLAASDTFRAAAIEQAEQWAERAGADIVKHQRGGDAAAVAFDAIQAAKARGAGIAIIDTAGRLHTKTPLMDELKKIKSVSRKEAPGAE
jgi:fused signal recognition particle receptor